MHYLYICEYIKVVLTFITLQRLIYAFMKYNKIFAGTNDICTCGGWVFVNTLEVLYKGLAGYIRIAGYTRSRIEKSRVQSCGAWSVTLEKCNGPLHKLRVIAVQVSG